MNEDSSIERFVKDPSLLVDLCHDVIDQLDAYTDATDIDEQQTQLREIAKTIERLEKAGVSVPDVLRAEKTRLAASLSIHADARQALTHLTDEFADILKDLRSRLGLDQGSDGGGTEKKTKKRSKLPRTDPSVLRDQIIQALRALGGKARAREVVENMGQQLDGKLLPGDLEWRDSTREYAWQNNAKWERYRMVQDGVLSNDSPRGIWELPEDEA